MPPFSPNPLLCQAHEARLQNQEEVLKGLAASDAASEVRFQMIQDSIQELSRHLTEAVERVERKVDEGDERVVERIVAIESKQDAQGDLLKSLTQVEATRSERTKVAKKLLIYVVGPATGALGTYWGGAVLAWLKLHIH